MILIGQFHYKKAPIFGFKNIIRKMESNPANNQKYEEDKEESPIFP